MEQVLSEVTIHRHDCGSSSKEEWHQYKTSPKHFYKTHLYSLEEVWTIPRVSKAANGTFHLFQPSGKPVSAPHTLKTKATLYSWIHDYSQRNIPMDLFGGFIAGVQNLKYWRVALRMTEEPTWPSCAIPGKDLHQSRQFLPCFLLNYMLSKFKAKFH